MNYDAFNPEPEQDLEPEPYNDADHRNHDLEEDRYPDYDYHIDKQEKLLNYKSMITTEIITNWELSLNDYQTNKLLYSKLDAIQCYNIDKQEKEENLHEQAWDIETYRELFYSDPAWYRDEYRENDDR